MPSILTFQVRTHYMSKAIRCYPKLTQAQPIYITRAHRNIFFFGCATIKGVFLARKPKKKIKNKKDKKKKKKDDDEPEMQILPEETVIKVFAFDKATRFDRVDNNKLAKLGFTYTCDVLIDENSPAVKIFNKQYQRKNNALPSYYATKGFDITYDTAIRIASGNGLKATFQKGTSYRVESKFEYSRMLFRTSYNEGIFIMEYNPDLTVTRLK